MRSSSGGRCDLEKERPCYDHAGVEHRVAQGGQGRHAVLVPVDVVIGVVAEGGDDVGDDGQEQRVGSEEDEAGEAVVAVAPAIAAYPDHDSGHGSAREQQRVPQPYLPFHGVVEGSHSEAGAAQLFLHCSIGADHPGRSLWIHRACY